MCQLTISKRENAVLKLLSSFDEINFGLKENYYCKNIVTSLILIVYTTYISQTAIYIILIDSYNMSQNHADTLAGGQGV